MVMAPPVVPTFVSLNGDEFQMRTDRIHRLLWRAGTTLWKRDGYSEFADWWCIYGCPSSPTELADYGGMRVLWGACDHPIDLTPGAAARHRPAYPDRVRRSWS